MSSILRGSCIVVGGFCLFILMNCTASRKQKAESAGVPIALMEIPRWSVEIAPPSRGAGGDSAAVLYSGAIKKTYPSDVQNYLEQVKDRLISKHKVDLSENFPEHGYIVIELKGSEIQYTRTAEELVLHEIDPPDGAGHTPHREANTTKMRSKNHTAVVAFYDMAGRGIWQLTVFDAKKPGKLADQIAKCLKRPGK